MAGAGSSAAGIRLADRLLSVGTVSTDSNGQRTFRDGSGRMTGTANTDSNGTSTIRNSNGQITGTVERPRG